MNLKRKKIIAREIIILSCVITIIFITYGGLKIANNKTINDRQALINEKLTFEARLDSIIMLPWNLNWNKKKPEFGKVYNENNSPNPELEYSKLKSNDRITIIEITNKLKLNKKATSNLSNFDTNLILIQFSTIFLLIVYPLRGLVLLLQWSIKTIKE